MKYFYTISKGTAYSANDPVNDNDPTGLYVVSNPNQFCWVEWLGEKTGPVTACLYPTLFGNVPGPTTDAKDDPIIDEWNNLSTECQDALKTAMPKTQIPAMIAALNRAVAAEPLLEKASAGTNIDWTMLGAIAIRESGFSNKNEADGAGVGVGVFQITVSSSSGVTAGQAGSLTWSANYAANLLNNNMKTLANNFPNLTPDQLLQATAASYNFGTGNISGNPNTIDVGTAHNNYGSNILGLMTCF